MKEFYIMNNVGNCKYLVNFYNGIKTNKDGSKFFDIRIFSNKKKMQNFIKLLKKDGYIEKN